MTPAILIASGWCAAAVLGVLHLRARRRLVLIARATHELRGPLCAARLGLGTVAGEPGRLAAIDLELARAGRALDDLTAAPTGTRRPDRPEHVDVAALARTYAATWTTLARAHGAELRLETDEPTPPLPPAAGAPIPRRRHLQAVPASPPPATWRADGPPPPVTTDWPPPARAPRHGDGAPPRVAAPSPADDVASSPAPNAASSPPLDVASSSRPSVASSLDVAPSLRPSVASSLDVASSPRPIAASSPLLGDASERDVTPWPFERVAAAGGSSRRSVPPRVPWRVPPPVPATVLADPFRIAQAVTNLVSNAAEHGGGTVRVRVTSTGERVRVEVADDGPGLPAPVRELAARSRNGRRGHGLAIALAIAEQLGGRLAAVPASAGARLVLDLPAAR